MNIRIFLFINDYSEMQCNISKTKLFPTQVNMEHILKQMYLLHIFTLIYSNNKLKMFQMS